MKFFSILILIFLATTVHSASDSTYPVNSKVKYKVVNVDVTGLDPKDEKFTDVLKLIAPTSPVVNEASPNPTAPEISIYMICVGLYSSNDVSCEIGTSWMPCPDSGLGLQAYNNHWSYITCSEI